MPKPIDKKTMEDKNPDWEAAIKAALESGGKGCVILVGASRSGKPTSGPIEFKECARGQHLVAPVPIPNLANRPKSNGLVI